MKALAPVLFVIIAAAVVISLGGVVFVVDEAEQVIITQFGKPVGDAINTPGVHYKLPFVQLATRFDKRFIEWNGDPNEVPTRAKYTFMKNQCSSCLAPTTGPVPTGLSAAFNLTSLRFASLRFA